MIHQTCKRFAQTAIVSKQSLSVITSIGKPTSQVMLSLIRSYGS
jgi:hypothetical protein